MVILLTILAYFAVLFGISRLTSRKGDNETFFRARRRAPWYMVAFGMVGASISGVTFVSVPGMVLQSQMTYLQVCLGFIVGYAVVAFVLLPLYYRLNLTSIYAYLGQRLGEWTHSYGNKATRKKVYAAKCTNFFKNLSVAEFIVEAVDFIAEGQELLITGETTGVYECIAKDLHDEKGESAKRIEKGQFFAIKTDCLIRRGDKLYLWEPEK